MDTKKVAKALDGISCELDRLDTPRKPKEIKMVAAQPYGRDE